MAHIEEFLLNEYLDGAVDQAQRRLIEAHLVECAQCRQSAAELRILFDALEEVVDVPLQVDISQRVVAELQPQRAADSRWVASLMGAQAVAAVAAIAWLWPTWQPWIEAAGRLTLETADRYQLLLTSFWEVLVRQASSIAEFAQPSPPLLGLAPGQWLLLVGLALLLWLAGNRLILTTDLNGGHHG